MSILTQKKCSKCGEWKDKSEFSKDKGFKDGLRSSCKTCESQRVRQWQKDNPEKARENDRRKQARWAAENPDKERNRKKKWRLDNLELAREIARNWVRNNLGKSNASTRNRRARIKGNGGEITLDEWEGLKAFYNYTCLCCKRREPEIKLTLDHVLPIAMGGKNVIENAQPLCGSCNSSKGPKHIDYR